MNFKHMLRAVSAAAMVCACSAASAVAVTLDFEGLQDLEGVEQFYNGGAGSLGSTGGTNYGVTFSGPALAQIDIDAGGTGNFGNEPSPNTVMIFLDANSAVMNYAAGFVNGFSFFYSSSVAASVTVWSEVGGQGDLLATIDLLQQGNSNCFPGDSGFFCNWTAIGVVLDFGEIARSINFGGTANQTGFDNITFGSASPGSGVVPEPASLALVGAALLGVAASRRRKV